MKPLRSRLQEARKRSGLPWEIIERDYLLSWVLAGISRLDILNQTLVFKGGTALKKCYFGDYRLSEDLDFSALGDVPKGNKMEETMREMCAETQKLLEEYAPIGITCERYTERESHPGGQEAFTIRARMPWQRESQTRVMVEVAVDEKILKPTKRKPVIHEYGEPLDVKVQVYSLEEIIAEKLRAILQHLEKFQERGWSRSRARDYYDLWRILGAYKSDLDLSDFHSLLREKCAVRNIGFKGQDDFFPETMLDYIEKTWVQWLGPLVPNLPPYKTVIDELRPQIADLLGK